MSFIDACVLFMDALEDELKREIGERREVFLAVQLWTHSTDQCEKN